MVLSWVWAAGSQKTVDQGDKGKRVPGSGWVLLGESMVQDGDLKRSVLGIGEVLIVFIDKTEPT